MLLTASALVLLVDATPTLVHGLSLGTMPSAIVDLFDRLLRVVMVVELLYTVQLAFREHSLAPEPFLFVGLIAATRRLLIVAAELTKLSQGSTNAFRQTRQELALLTAMVLVVARALPPRRPTLEVAQRA